MTKKKKTNMKGKAKSEERKDSQSKVAADVSVPSIVPHAHEDAHRIGEKDRCQKKVM